MINYLHILGPSGSGTTTTAQKLSQKYNLAHFDADDYFWKQTDPPYQKVRAIKKRQALLQKDLKGEEKWIISGSFCGWGDIFKDQFDLVIYLWAPINIRLHRLRRREQKKFGSAVLPGGKMYKRHQQFLDSAAKYDYDQTEFRNKKSHEKWLNSLNCPVIKISGEKSTADILAVIASKIDKIFEKGFN